MKFLADANESGVSRHAFAHMGADIAADRVILGELRSGTIILPQSGPRLKWAELLARLRATGKAMPIKDSLIAATAVVHGLAIATRNRTDFVNARVRIVDPFAG